VAAGPARLAALKPGADTGPRPAVVRWKMAVLLASLSMVSPFSIDSFFPSFHAIADYFGISRWAVQQTLTAYMLPLSMMSLIQGPLSDALGRRPVILGGLGIYTLASIGCAAAPTFPMLLVFRALQGLSAGVGMIVGRAVIRDLYEGPQAQRLLSLVTMIFGFAPAVAPVIGGWIHVALGWRAVFGFMMLVGMILWLSAYFVLPETHPREKRPRLHVGELAATAWGIVRHSEFLLLATAMGANFAAMMSFIGAAPAVVVDHWHLHETEFAYLFMPVIGGIVAGAWASGQMAGRLAHERQLRIGFLLSLTTAALMIALQLLLPHLRSPLLLLQQVLLGTIAFGVQLVAAPLTLRMLDLFPRARGSAASVQSCVSIAIAAFVFGFLSPVLSGSMLTLAAGSFCAALIALSLWQLAQRALRRSTLAPT
jgi:MFS transporter, DHA1 family, multidrug resistance protein